MHSLWKDKLCQPGTACTSPWQRGPGILGDKSGAEGVEKVQRWNSMWSQVIDFKWISEEIKVSEHLKIAEIISDQQMETFCCILVTFVNDFESNLVDLKVIQLI